VSPDDADAAEHERQQEQNRAQAAQTEQPHLCARERERRQARQQRTEDDGRANDVQQDGESLTSDRIAGEQRGRQDHQAPGL
jgi:hypothetical protein